MYAAAKAGKSGKQRQNNYMHCYKLESREGKIREISVRKYNIRQISAVKLLMLDKVRSFNLCQEAWNLPKSHPLSNYFDSLKINKIFHVLSKVLSLNSVSVYFRKVNYHIL